MLALVYAHTYVVTSIYRDIRALVTVGVITVNHIHNE